MIKVTRLQVYTGDMTQFKNALCRLQICQSVAHCRPASFLGCIWSPFSRPTV